MKFLTPLFTTWEFWNFVIAVTALMISIYSIWYTKRNDKHSIEIVDCYINQKNGRPTMIMFAVLNNSNSSIKLLNVELFFYSGSPVNPLEYIPEQTYSTHGQTSFVDVLRQEEYSEPFDGEVILAPYSKEEFSYYLNPYSRDLKIKITCDRPIKGFRKSRLIPVHFKKFD